LGVPASEYQDHLRDSPAFADAIRAAAPIAKEKLFERATRTSLGGNDKLLRQLLDEREQLDSNRIKSAEEMRAECRQLYTELERYGLIQHRYLHKPSGQIIDDRDLEPVPADASTKGI
jgi:hypothetical protein